MGAMPALTIITHSFQDLKEYIEKAISIIPSTGDVLREVDRARTPESRVRVWSRSLDPIDSVGQPYRDRGGWGWYRSNLG